MLNYGRSKLAQILYTVRLAEEVRSRKILVNSLHPGLVDTKLLVHVGWESNLKPEVACEHVVALAAAPELSVSGEYWEDGELAVQRSPISRSHDEANHLWDASMSAIAPFLTKTEL